MHGQLTYLAITQLFARSAPDNDARFICKIQPGWKYLSDS